MSKLPVCNKLVRAAFFLVLQYTLKHKIRRMMKHRGVSESVLGEMIVVKRPLSKPLTLRLASEIATALDCQLVIEFRPLESEEA